MFSRRNIRPISRHKKKQDYKCVTVIQIAPTGIFEQFDLTFEWKDSDLRLVTVFNPCHHPFAVLQILRKINHRIVLPECSVGPFGSLVCHSFNPGIPVLCGVCDGSTHGPDTTTLSENGSGHTVGRCDRRDTHTPMLAGALRVTSRRYLVRGSEKRTVGVLGSFSEETLSMERKTITWNRQEVCIPSTPSNVRTRW